MSQQALGDAVGVSANTVRAWEQGAKKPSMDALIALSDYFKVSLDCLIGRNDSAQNPELADISVRRLAERYRQLDQYGKSAVEEICRIEWERVMNNLQAENNVEIGEPERILRIYSTPSAAGVNVPLDSEEYEMLPVGDDVPARADFGVRIRGESMMPYIRDGDIVYVDKDAVLQIGDVGIFAVDGALYCKIYYVDPEGNLILVSANPDLQDANIAVDRDSGQNVTVFGKVLGYGRVRMPESFYS